MNTSAQAPIMLKRPGDTRSSLDLINEIECKFDVLSLKIRNVHVWPLVRGFLSHELDHYQKNIEHRVGKPANGLMKQVLAFFQGYLRARRARKKQTPHFLEHADVFFLTMSTARRFQVDDKFYCSFSDAFVDLGLAKTAVVYEFLPHFEDRLPTYRPSNLIGDTLCKLKMAAILKRQFYPGEFVTPKAFSEFREFLQEKAPYISVEWSLFVKQFFYIDAVSRFFEKRLKAHQSVAAISFGWYDYEGFALNLACSRLGLISMDMQHGAQGERQPFYSRFKAVPKKGFALMPNVFLVWSKEEIGVIEKWSHDVAGHQAVAFGSPLRQLFKERKSPFRGDTELAATQVNILWILGPYVPEQLRHVIEAASTHWFWRLRLHPAYIHVEDEVRLALDSVASNRFEILAPSQQPVEAFLENCHAVVADRSSVIVEASEFGVGSVSLCSDGADIFPDLAACGYVVAASDPIEIVKELKRLIALKSTGAIHNPNLHQTSCQQMATEFQRLLTRHV